MRNLPLQKIILSILILVILIGISGCQSNPVKGMDNIIRSLAHVPDQLGRIVTDLIGGLRDIGGAMADQVKNIVQGMTGR
jgi:hypothetical protein